MTKKCPICNDLKASSTFISYKNNESDIVEYTCPNCGTYRVDQHFETALNYKRNPETGTIYDVDKLKLMLFYYLKVLKPASICLIHTDNYSVPNLDDIYRLYPKTFSEKLNMIMELLHTQITDVGTPWYIKIGPANNISYDKTHYVIEYCFFALTTNEENRDNYVKNMLKALYEIGYIYQPNEKNKEHYIIEFTPKGWGKIDSLQRNRKSKTAFIAMSFKRDSNTTDNEDIKNLISKLQDAEGAIKTAIEKAGYTPIIIKDKVHNQSIPQEIEFEIKRAAFVVADLTLQNNGAYYEAGIAKGLGKEVIFTCNENDFENIHFDTKQINTIKWLNKNKFIDDLYNRIKFTVGKYSEIN